MVLYLDKQEYAIFSSPNLMDWTETDRFKLEGADECPDFFEMSVTNEPTVRKWVFTVPIWLGVLMDIVFGLRRNL